MKKLSLTLIIVLLAFNKSAISQNIENQFESLQLNSAPAYVILGVEPENIQRPNSPTEFMANAHSAIVNKRLQPNFALETSPYYWGKKKPASKKFNILDYVFSNQFGENLARSITFTFATSPTDSFTFGSRTPGTGMGIGIHLQLFQGRADKNLSGWIEKSRLKSLINDAISVLQQNNSIENIDDWIDNTLTKTAYINFPENFKQNLKKQFLDLAASESLAKSDISRLSNLDLKVGKQASKYLSETNNNRFPLTRQGFMMELSVANASIVSNNIWDSIRSAKTAIWLTPSYRFNANKDGSEISLIDLMAVFRFTGNAIDVDSSDYLDAGLKLQWIHNRISLSSEVIYRFLTHKPESQDKHHTNRTSFTFNYKINELVTFQASFGSNFNGNSTVYDDPKNMFAVGGVNFGFGDLITKKK